jgi:hypothetical protein
MLANAERTRKLAEKGQAELDRRKQQREPAQAAPGAVS